jgi:hypothetical protein
MCVILIAEDRPLTEAMVDRPMAANRDGNGLAWIDANTVHFARGLSAPAVRRLVVDLPLPYVFHARIATVGGVRRDLCHPFPLDRRLRPGTLRGTSSRGVLFHNGHWSEWRDYEDASGPGAWSDSRAMARLVSRFGHDVLAHVVPTTQRVALLTRDGVERFGDGWYPPEDGIWASNRAWQYGGSCDPRVTRRAPTKATLGRAEVSDHRQRRLALA